MFLVTHGFIVFLWKKYNNQFCLHERGTEIESRFSDLEAECVQKGNSFQYYLNIVIRNNFKLF